MKLYTCAKPCTIGGKRFIIGDTIPGDLVAPEREKALVSYGIIAVSEADQKPAEAVQMPAAPIEDKPTAKEPMKPTEPPKAPAAANKPEPAPDADAQKKPEPTTGQNKPTKSGEGKRSAAKPGKKVQK